MAKDKELDITIVEDIEHLGSLWSESETKNSDVRNSVQILRRLLIYGDLQKSANARKYEITINSPDVNPFIKATRYGLINFFQCGGTNVLGVQVSGFMVHQGQSHRLSRIMRDHHPDKRVELKIRSFLHQPVFSFQGNLITREDVIKFVCNKAGSAHFDRRNRDATIERIRSAVQIQRTADGAPSIGFNIDALNSPDFAFDPDPKRIDPVLIEAAASARYVAESPAILRYCDLLKEEYGF